MACKYSKNQCGSCFSLRDKDDDNTFFEGTAYEKGYCLELRSYYYPDDKICSYYKDRETYIPGTGCYITTIICGKLGLPDNCGVLTTLRHFRNDIMQKDPKYKEILYEYDEVGPKIAECIKKEFTNPEPDELLIVYYNFYLQPTARLVDEKKYDEAIARYVEMTNSLKEYFNIEEVEKVPEEYDYTQGGHGYVKKYNN